MKIRTYLAVLLTPLFAGLAFAAIAVDPVAKAQRILMMTNQATIITNQLTQIAEMEAQLTQMTEQYTHLQEQALGSIGAITEPFTELASKPAQLLGVGLAWKDEFTGVAAELASSVEQMGETGKSFTESWRSRLDAADTVTETDILDLYAGYRPEVAAKALSDYLAAREEGDKRLVLGHATSDAAGNLMAAAREAVASYTGLSNNANLSNTALAQAQVAGQVTAGNLAAAMAQLMAFQAAKESAEDYEREIARRKALARRVAAQQQAEITFAAQQAGLDARRDSMRDGLLFRIHPLYGGTSP